MISTGFQYGAAVYTDALTLGPNTLAKRGFLFVYNNPATYQIARLNASGRAEWIPVDQNTAISFQPFDNCQGIRVRAYDLVNPPLVNIILMEIGDPDIGFQPILRTATISSGKITIQPIPVT